MPRSRSERAFSDASIARIIFDADPEPGAVRPKVAPPIQRGSLAAQVLGARPAQARRSVLGVGIITALAAHGLAWLALSRNPARGEEPPEPPSTVLEIAHVVDLDPPEPVPEPVEAEPAPATSDPVPVATAAPATPSEPPPSDARPPPPAQAGEVVAAEGPVDPLDFTGFDITTGRGDGFAGGVTASDGTNTAAVQTRAVDRTAPPNQPQAEASLAQPVSLPARNWQCPWPREAETLGIDEQMVVLRVVVGAQGRVSAAELIADPGHGFGEAALTCARNARFAPARDRSGQPYAATSPPIRVRFTR